MERSPAAPWSLQEEYLLALMHSKVGGQWSLIAEKLPGRTAQSIMNHWCATVGPWACCLDASMGSTQLIYGGHTRSACTDQCVHQGPCIKS